ncbi:unannotated protein [freshwater metagenome]|uniref:Unannotated protein n=1 Tax=freshwater metagenome TaxID=449393 RepID=A0A6J6Z5M1_9ZZZZ
MNRPSSRPRAIFFLVFVALVSMSLTACGDDADPQAAQCLSKPVATPIDANKVAATDTKGTEITLVTHDSFAVSDGVLAEFTKQTGITVKLLSSGDAGQMVSQAVLTAGNPVADVMFGIDNTLLCRGLLANLFTPYTSSALAEVPDSLELDPFHRVSPIDVGDVCLNYAKAAYATNAARRPSTISPPLRSRTRS